MEAILASDYSALSYAFAAQKLCLCCSNTA